MLTIGDFSRLSRVTPRMLRHYDALGLLRPQQVGENGYRYYRQEQLSRLTQIQWLKGCGFSLVEIGPLLDMEEHLLLPLLREKRESLRRELDTRQALLRRLEADILRMEGITSMNKNQYQVILLEDPAQKVFSIRRTVGVDQYHTLFQELRQEAAARGLTQAGPIQMLYHDGPDVSIKPPCTCAAVQHSGPYEELHLAYEALCGWLGEHTEYRICGPAMDRYLNDPHSTPPDSLETGVLFPVQRR